MAKKASMGRQKIKIQKIEDKNHLQVTFSKRRSGLFKKASELCTLCGVDIAVIVFSPAGKAFSFGHPSVESIIDRFLARHQDPFLLLDQARRNAGLRELNMQLGQILNELEVERKRGEGFDTMRKTGEKDWEAPVDKLGLEEMEQLRDAMEELKRTVSLQASRLTSIFVTSDGPAGFFDQYESKPSQAIVGSNMNCSAPVGSFFGYCHGFF